MISLCPKRRSKSPAMSFSTDCIAAADKSRISAARTEAVDTQSKAAAIRAGSSPDPARAIVFVVIACLLLFSVQQANAVAAAAARPDIVDRLLQHGLVDPEVERHFDLSGVQRPGLPDE